MSIVRNNDGFLSKQIVTEVAKHGSHDQSTHGKKGPKGPKGPESEGTPKSAAYSAALEAAKNGGADKAEIRKLENAHKKGNEDTLMDLEASSLEAHADWSNVDGESGSVASQEAKGSKLLHTATVMALRDVTGATADEWPTIDEMEDM